MTFYSIVKFVPDPVREECINVGVIAVDDETASIECVSRFGRARTLAGFTPDFLKAVLEDFRMECEAVKSPALIKEVGVTPMTVERLCWLSSNWATVVQLTTPTPSLGAPQEVAAKMYARFVDDKRESRGQVRSLRSANKIARGVLMSKVDLLAESGLEVLAEPELPGHIERSHRLGFGVKNGVIKMAGMGLSFEIAGEEQLQSDVTNVIHSLADVRRADDRLKLYVFSLGSVATHKSQESRLKGACKKMSVSIVNESQGEAWATKTLKALMK